MKKYNTLYYQLIMFSFFIANKNPFFRKLTEWICRKRFKRSRVQALKPQGSKLFWVTRVEIFLGDKMTGVKIRLSWVSLCTLSPKII